MIEIFRDIRYFLSLYEQYSRILYPVHLIKVQSFDSNEIVLPTF